jgi:glyoxylase-like metal-dependent hydrolase (beta-lactamase superfamily II)
MALARSVEAGKLLPLPDGASLHAGEGPWRVLHCPGHARDHLCLLHRESGSLIGGDLLLRSRRTVPWLESRREDGSRPATLADLIRSWRRLSRQRLEIVWPGHGRPVRAHRILVARRIAETREGLQATLEAVTGGAATVGELAGALDMSVTADGLFASLSEIVARTDWLVERGLLERRTATGVLRFLPR